MMIPFGRLKTMVSGLDGKGYKAYKSLKGEYDYDDFFLIIDHVQGDPYAQPSRFRVRMKRSVSGYPLDLSSSKTREIALCDFLTRRFAMACDRMCGGVRESGKSGLIAIDRPLQEILERSSMVVSDATIEARFFVALPANGRRITADLAITMLFDELPRIVLWALKYDPSFRSKVYDHVETAEDADYLRNKLAELGLVGFVGAGSVLPRKSGIDPRPMDNDEAVSFIPPESYSVAVDVPNRGRMTGMGIPKGVTLIVGGGFHGKSTLLKALELGVYNHIPGDGREFTVSGKGTVKVRSADGRSIINTDISSFITNLPNGKDTRTFSTGNASGSTSQAAGISEAIEAGADVLLLDEDTSATNFMIRDEPMQQLVADQWEPITPFIRKIKSMYREHGISTVIVMGGSGDYFSEADHVIQMKLYQPVDVTHKAYAIANRWPKPETSTIPLSYDRPLNRFPSHHSFNPLRYDGKLTIKANGKHEIVIGNDAICFSDVEQIVEISQTRAIAHAIHYAMTYMDMGLPLRAVTERVVEDIETNRLDILVPWCRGDLAWFRSLELAAVINRARSLVARQEPNPTSEY